MTKYNGKEIDFITKGHCYLFVFVCLIFFLYFILVLQ